MKRVRSRTSKFQAALLLAPSFVLLVSIALVFRMVAESRARALNIQRLDARSAENAAMMGFQSFDELLGMISRPGHFAENLSGLLIGELRVVAIGSAYPIPYDAAVCPFTGVPQPEMNQMDRDGDGITDDWELKYGFDKYNAADAKFDGDGDGFTNKEEFTSGTEPDNSRSHPPYAEKLRFVERIEVPFPFVFQGVTELSDGSRVFQINTPSNGKSHFVSVGDALEGIVVQHFVPEEENAPARLFVRRGSYEVELQKGRVAADPESQAELINILDRSREMVTMGTLLSLHDNTYAVLGVHPDKVVLRDTETGIVYDIEGLAEGE